MNKKTAILVFLIVIISAVIVAMVLTVYLHNDDKKADNTSNYDYNTDELISDFINSDDYKNADRMERKRMTLELLEKLKRDGKINFYNFDESNSLYSFSYPDGTLGGIYIEDYSDEMN